MKANQYMFSAWHDYELNLDLKFSQYNIALLINEDVFD